MIPQIKEIKGKFPENVTISTATVTLNDMGDKTISAQVKVDGRDKPDFSYDWEVEFQGERYIQPLREPQASKGNESLYSTIDLVFQHKAIYELKRYYFPKMAEVGSGTTSVDTYIADLNLNLEQFCDALQQVLDHYEGIGYFKEHYVVDLKGKGEVGRYAQEPQYVKIQYSHIWDVLLKLYEVYGIRWSIQGNTIYVGHDTEEVAHTFEYGFEGGLLKVERQVQSADIRNSLLGRGGSKNLPYRYFKEADPNNPSFQADPDAIPELANIYFNELRGKTFRDYVKGWKAKHYGGTPMSEPTEAYTKGYNDTTFNPIEYVEDKDSIDKYRLLQGGLENQEDIYPTIQGVEVDGLGRVDEIVGVEKVLVDENAENAISDIVKITPMPSVSSHFSPQYGGTSTPLFRYKIGEFTIPEGFVGINIDKSNLSYAFDYVKDSLGRYTWGTNPHNPKYFTPADTNIIPLFDFTNYTLGVFKDGTSFDSNYAFYNNSIKGALSSGDYYIAIQGYFKSTNEDDWEKYGSCYWNFALNSAYIKLVKGFIVGEDVQEKISISKESEDKRNIHIGAITVPSEGATMVDIPIETSTNTDIEGEYIVSKKIKVVDSEGIDVSSINIPEGKFDIYVEVNIENLSQYDTEFTITAGKGVVVLATDSEEWQPTFDIWVKNIWNTTRNAGESEQAYVDRVWTPILGDREGNEAKVVFTTGWLAGHSDYEFVIRDVEYAGGSGVELGGVPAEWKITLIKSDAEIEATGKWIPSTTQQANAGDKFFFIGIDMPHEYTLWAEQAVDNYKRDQLLKTAHIKPTWVVQTDKVRLNQQDEEGEKLLDKFKVGNTIKLADSRFIESPYEKLYLQSVTYTWDAQTTMLPNVEVVLSDKYEVSANPVAKLQGEVDVLAKQVGSISNVQQVVRAVGDKLYLRKDGFEEVSNSPTEFNKLVSSRGYRQGAVGGNGWGLRSEQGKGIFECDKLIVRDEMQVNSLVVNQVSAIGGKEILSAASIECSKVEVLNEGFKCYFDQKRGSVANLFQVNDIAYSQVFSSDGEPIKYYKRCVIGVGDNYILLSNNAEESDGEGAPQVGDVIVQYGNIDQEKTERQYVIIRDVIGGGYERMLSGLDSVNAEGVEYYFAGRLEGNTPRWFVGNATGHYAEWNNDTLKIKGTLEIGSDVGGATVVEGGLVTAESIILGSGENVKAGITGVGESDSNVRIWAGASSENKDDAPFRVTQDGKLYASDAEIEGRVNAGGTGSGDMVIKDGTISVKTDPPRAHEVMSLNGEGLRVESDKYSKAIIGYTDYFGEAGMVNIEVTEADDPGYHVSALYILRGRIKGLRYTMRRVDTDDYIDTMDTVIRNTSNTPITLQLPEGAEDGQMYVIIGGASTTLTISGNNKIKSYGADFADSFTFQGDYTKHIIYDAVGVFINGVQFGVWHVS